MCKSLFAQAGVTSWIIAENMIAQCKPKGNTLDEEKIKLCIKGTIKSRVPKAKKLKKARYTFKYIANEYSVLGGAMVKKAKR